MGLIVGHSYKLACNYCSNETAESHDQDALMTYALRLGWLKNYITGNCTCPDCRKKSNEKLDAYIKTSNEKLSCYIGDEER